MPKRNLAWIVVIGLIAVLFWRMPQNIAQSDSFHTAFSPLLEVRAQLLKNTAVPVNDGELCAIAARAGIDAMIRALNDPYALFLNREAFAEFRKRTEGVFGGIGVDVRMSASGLRVLASVRGGPADRGGIQPGNILLRIDGAPVAELGLVESVNRLNGPPGTSLVLFVADRAGRTREIRLQRDTIEVNPVRGWRRTAEGGWQFLLDDRRRIGYVRLVKFMPNAARELDQVLVPLTERGLRGLILDLRENTGGLLPVAIDVADRFLASGLIVATRGPRAPARQWLATREGTYPVFPVVLLVNESTASAAEIVAGALQDHGRALVVGERTYGKGSVQELIAMSDGESALKLTTAHYYLPSGRCLDRRGAAPADPWGVEPDVTVAVDELVEERALETWQALAAEPNVPPPDDDEPASDAVAPSQSMRSGSDASENPQDEATARTRLLEADPQLRRAYELLTRSSAAADTRPATRAAAPVSP